MIAVVAFLIAIWIVAWNPVEAEELEPTLDRPETHGSDETRRKEADEPAGARGGGGGTGSESAPSGEGEESGLGVILDPKGAVAPDDASAPVSEASGAASARPVIEEIVVTAQKLKQSLRDVPISISVLDSEFMTEQNIIDFRDVSRYTANFRVNNDGGNIPPPDIRIRGFGTAQANRAFEQAVGLAIDGDTFGQQEFFRGALFDVERIEVLKGPQGTLFGKNTTAGLVNLVLKDPTDRFEGFVDFDLGDFDRRRVEAAVGGPVVPNILNFRIAGVSADLDGFMENTSARTVPKANELLGGTENEGLRVRVEFPSLWGASLLLSGEHSEAENFGLPVEIVEAQPQALRNVLLKYDPNLDLIDENYVGSLEFPSRGRRKTDRFVALASTDWAGWGLNAVVGYSLLDAFESVDPDGTPIPLDHSTTNDDLNQTTFEFRASSPILPGLFGMGQFLGFGLGRTEFTAGFFYQQRHYTTHTEVPLNFGVLGETFAATFGVEPTPTVGEPVRVPIPCPGSVPCGRDYGGYSATFSSFSQDTRSYAGFGQMRWYLADRWTLEPGIRLTYETKDADVARIFDSPQSEFLWGFAAFEAFDEDLARSETKFTPKIALIYDVTDDINVYGSWALGFKSGGFNENGTVRDGLTFEDEEVRAWELGTKMRLLRGAAALNFALFWMNATDIQLYTFEPPRPEDVLSFGRILTTNAGEGRSRGFEADATWLPTSWLTLRDSLGFVDSEYLDFPIGGCEAGLANTDGDSDLRCDLTGESFEFTPKWVNTLTGSVRLPLESLGVSRFPFTGVDLLGSLTARYEDVHFVNNTLTFVNRQPSFFKLDAHLGFGNLPQGWSVTVTGQNLTDEVTYTTRRRLVVDGLTNAFASPPRQFFASVRWEF